jgi:hypothetical protein
LIADLIWRSDTIEETNRFRNHYQQKDCLALWGNTTTAPSFHTVIPHASARQATRSSLWSSSVIKSLHLSRRVVSTRQTIP